MLVGAAVTQTVRFICHWITPSLFIHIAKGDDEATRQTYSVKAAEFTFRTIYFSFAMYWGWYSMKDSKVLVAGLGGPIDGEFWSYKWSTIFGNYT